MPGASGWQLPAPKDWQEFERLCRDLWAEIWRDPNAQLNGRSGQPQHGVDIFGEPKDGVGMSGVQCKRRGTAPDNSEICGAELEQEVAKARSFAPPLRGHFVLATTGPQDAKIQEVARRLTEEHRQEGLFSVHVWAWDAIEEELLKYPAVFEKHYGGIAAMFRTFSQEHFPESDTDGLANFRAKSDPGSSRPAVVPIGHLDVSGVLEPEHRAQIEAARDLLTQGEASLALKQAEALRARIWPSASNLAKAHLTAVEAYAKLELGRDDEAARELANTTIYAPDDPATQANVALGHLMQGASGAADTWSKKALSQRPNIIAAQVSVLLDDRDDATVMHEIESTFGRRAELASALGHRAAKAGDLVRAQTHFLRALELAPDRSDIQAIAGQVIVDVIASTVEPKVGTTVKQREQLLRAVDLLDQAWSATNDAGVRVARVSWIASRTVAKRLLGATDVAASADEVLKVGGRRKEFITIRAAIALDSDDYETVVRLLADNTISDPEMIGMRAAARANLGDAAGSILDWEALLGAEPPPSPPLREQAEQNYLLTLLKVGRADDARSTVERWLAATPEDVPRLLTSVETLRQCETNSVIDARLNSVVGLLVDGTPVRTLLRAGDVLLGAKRPADAANAYQRAFAIEGDTTYARRLIDALYLAGRFESSLKACQTLRQHGGSSLYVTEVESVIHEESGTCRERGRSVRRTWRTIRSQSTWRFGSA